MKELKAKIQETVRKIEQNCPEAIQIVQQDILRLEALQNDQTIPQAVKSQHDVTGTLSAMYRVVNTLLAFTTLAMEYPIKQWDWPDSQPLETLAEMYPVLHETHWYQLQLSTIMMKPEEPRHPWIHLPEEPKY